MECTRYAAGLYLSEKDVARVEGKVAEKYPNAQDSELEAIARDAIVSHNQATSILTKLGGMLEYDVDGSPKIAVIESVELVNGGKVKVELKSGDSYTFSKDKDGDFVTGNVVSSSLTKAWHSTPRRGISLFNNEASMNTLDEVFSGVSVDIDTVDNTMSKMAELDQKATNSRWDAKHSEHLRNVVKGFVQAGVNAGKAKVTVTKNIIEVLNEPMAEFNPNKPAGSKIRIATANIVEQAQNRLIMSNQEALTHEVTHSVLDFAFSNNLDVVGQDIKTDIRKLYRQAKEQLTYESMVPKDATNAEVEKAKEMYDYVFNGKLGENTIVDANKRLQEFIAYGVTNKHFKQAVDGLPLATKKMKIGQYDSWVERTVKTIINAVQGFISTLSHKKNRASTVGGELTRLVYKLTVTQQKYTSKAKRNSHMPINEKIGAEANKQIDKIDKKIKKYVETGLEQVGLGKDSKYTDKEIEKKADDLLDMMDTFEKAGKMKKALLFPQIIAQTGLIMRESEKHEASPHYAVIMSKILYHMDNVGLSFAKDLAADFSAGRKTLEKITDMAMQFNSHLDRFREMNYLGALNDVYNGFSKVNLNKRDNRKYAIAMNKVVLRGDLQALTTDAKELNKILTNEKYVATKIGKLEASISALEYDDLFGRINVGSDMVAKAKQLAKYMVTGMGLRTNAENIVRNFGTVNAIGYDVNIIPEYNIAEVTQQIEELASLYALEHISEEHKSDIVELAGKDADGLSRYLANAKGMQSATKEDWLISGNMQDMVKGQLHEKSNGDKDIQYAPLKDARKMKELGYRLIRKMDTDSADPIDTEYGLYATDEVGLTRRVDGTLGLQRIGMKGLLLSEKTRLEYEGLSPANLAKKVRDTIVKAAQVNKVENMTPVYNDQGMIIDFRYDYGIQDKEVHLGMEQRGTELLARSFGQRHTQDITDTDNRELIDTVYKDYDNLDLSGEIPKDTTHLYVKVEAVQRGNLTKKEKTSGKIFSDDNVYTARTQGEELWGLLPPDARKYIVQKNEERRLAKIAKKLKKSVKQLTEEEIGDTSEDKSIYIRKDLIKQTFGYDELSIADSKLFSRLPDVYKRKIRLAGRVWGDFMQIAKASVVVKLPSTVVGNILSNAKFFYYNGIPIKKSVELLLLSKKSLDKWKEDETEIRRLERKIDGAEGNSKIKLEKRLAEVKAERDDNPLKPLMDEGMYQTIVDDVALDDSNNKVVNWAEEKLGKLVGDNKTIEEIVHTLVLSRKSTLGKAALNITAESDLHFRAVIYWYGKEQIDKSSLSLKEKKAAMIGLLREIRDNFLNGSKVINSRSIQWLDRMGPEAFWRYFANIQKVNLRLLKTKTAKVAADMTAEKLLGIPAGTLDSSIIFRWDNRLNPLSWYDNVTSLIEGATEVPIANLIEGW